MVSSLEEIDAFAGYPIHEPMFLSDTPRPATGKHIFQWFGFPRALKGIPHDRFNEIENSDRDAAFVFDPKSEVLKKLGLKYSEPFRLSLHRASLSAKRLLS